MPTIDDNIDRFEVHPTYALTALLPDRERVDGLTAALAVDLDDDEVVEVIHGDEGLRILDQRGVRHGFSARLTRLMQDWTYYREILEVYTEGLTDGEFLAVIPCAPDQRLEVALTVESFGGRLIYYYGYGTVESIIGR
ncbi:hypothetical protein [Actinoplanes solisilvae]|uniref:hypothetical protein n=1 Tax=Actinoplanes solisilvae TaxID=2486853 RepID=UPI000FD6C70F|nr:hypothetical protein [Actinoplanes solisilvae]